MNDPIYPRCNTRNVYVSRRSTDDPTVPRRLYRRMNRTWVRRVAAISAIIRPLDGIGLPEVHRTLDLHDMVTTRYWNVVNNAILALERILARNDFQLNNPTYLRNLIVLRRALTNPERRPA